jgi:hypothetical protein
MVSLKAAAGLAAAVLALAGCATPERVALAPVRRAAIAELRTHVAVVPAEAPAALPAVAAVPLDAAEHRRAFDEALRRELPRYPIALGAISAAAQPLDADERARLFAELKPAQALLLIEPQARLSADARTLEADAVVSLWTRETGERRPVQRALLRYRSQPQGAGGAASLAGWAADDGAAWRAALRESVAETIDMALLEFDLAVPPALTEPPRAFAVNAGGPDAAVRGQLLKETARRATVLGEDGRLYSLPKPAGATDAASAAAANTVTAAR